MSFFIISVNVKSFKTTKTIFQAISHENRYYALLATVGGDITDKISTRNCIMLSYHVDNFSDSFFFWYLSSSSSSIRRVDNGGGMSSFETSSRTSNWKRFTFFELINAYFFCINRWRILICKI